MGTHHHSPGAGHHHHHVPESASLNRIFVFCVALNLAFVVIEAGVGFYYNSVGLLSDAGHNLGDVFSLLLALLAFRMAKGHANGHFTYGYKKSTILISLVNAVILLVAVGAILIEAIYRLRHPEPVSGAAIGWTAGIGIVVNGLTAWLLMRDQERDLNVRGAFLHMLMDTLVSVGVVVSGAGVSALPPPQAARENTMAPARTRAESFLKFFKLIYLPFKISARNGLDIFKNVPSSRARAYYNAHFTRAQPKFHEYQKKFTVLLQKC